MLRSALKLTQRGWYTKKRWSAGACRSRKAATLPASCLWPFRSFSSDSFATMKMLMRENDEISPTTIRLMTEEAIKRNDIDTLHLLLNDPSRSNKVSIPLLQNCFKFCIDQSVAPHFQAAAQCIRSYLEKSSGRMTDHQEIVSHPISCEDCQFVLTGLTNQLKWQEASYVFEFMVHNKYSFNGNERESSFVAHGLMNEGGTKGIARVLELLTIVADYERSDLSELFSLPRNDNDNQDNNTDRDRAPRRLKVAEGPLLLLSKLLSRKLEEGWYSSSISKMLIALSYSNGYHDIAIDFIQQSFANAIDKEQKLLNQSSNGNCLDVLHLLKAHSAGIAMIHHEQQRLNRKVDRYVSYLLLDNSVEYLKANAAMYASGYNARDILRSTLRSTDFLNLYWLQAFRMARLERYKKAYIVDGDDEKDDDFTEGGSITLESLSDTALDLQSISDSYPRKEYSDGDGNDNNENKQSQQQGNRTKSTERDEILVASYNQLKSFFVDTEYAMTASPAPGYHRRIFRHLCDELGFRHTVVELIGEKSGGVGDTYGIKVWKHQGAYGTGRLTPPTLNEIMSKDARRGNKYKRFDNPPKHWQVVHNLMGKKMDREALTVCMERTISNMKRSNPSISWGLLGIELLKGDSPFYLKNPSLLRHLLQMAMNRNDTYGLMELLYINEESRFHKSTKNKRGISGVMNKQDWAEVFHNVYASRNHIPLSFRNTFLDLVRLMRSSDVPLDGNILRVLLKFSVHSDAQKSGLSSLLERIHESKGLAVGHEECVSLTYHLLGVLRSAGYNDMTLKDPLYKSQNYLFVHPEATSKILSAVIDNEDLFGQTFMGSFEESWNDIYAEKGRNEILRLLTDILADESKRKKLVTMESDRARECLSRLSIYTAYLHVAYCKNRVIACREAFNILYSVYQIIEEAKIIARENPQDEDREGVFYRYDDDEEEEEEEEG